MAWRMAVVAALLPGNVIRSIALIFAALSAIGIPVLYLIRYRQARLVARARLWWAMTCLALAGFYLSLGAELAGVPIDTPEHAVLQMVGLAGACICVVVFVLALSKLHTEMDRAHNAERLHNREDRR